MAGDQTIGIDTYFRIIEMAAKIEPDQVKLHDWFHEDPIVEMDSVTAKSLIESGKDQLLEEFLISILAGARE